MTRARQALTGIFFLPFVATVGCGGTVYTGYSLNPPPPGEAAVRAAFDRRPLGKVDGHKVIPAGVRAYQTNDIVVDMLVVADDKWLQSILVTEPNNEAHTQYVALYATNGIEMPPEDPGEPRVLLHTADGALLHLTRGFQSTPPTPEQREQYSLVRAERDIDPVYQIPRDGTLWWASIVPILFHTDRPLHAGETVQVRLALRRPRFDMDQTPCSFTVEPVSQAVRTTDQPTP